MAYKSPPLDRLYEGTHINKRVAKMVKVSGYAQARSFYHIDDGKGGDNQERRLTPYLALGRFRILVAKVKKERLDLIS